MATTRLMPVHAGKSRSIATTLRDSTGYVENPDKTYGGELISAFECDPRTVDAEFLLAKREYAAITGREQGKNDVLAYHLRQAFKPGEITPEAANRIGYELATAFTKGRHAFIVATHIDKAHIHNHIIFNSTVLSCDRKFRNFWGSTKALRRISDRFCVENGLSIVVNPQPSRGHYGTGLGEEKSASYQEKLRRAVDAVLSEKHADFDVFLRALEERGYEVKRGKQLAFRASDQQRFTRLRALGDEYSEQAIRECISGKRTHAPSASRGQIMLRRSQPKLNLLIDVENSIRIKGSPGYERWVKVFNLKQAAQTLIFLQERGLDEYDKLDRLASAASVRQHELAGQVKAAEARLAEIAALQKHISNYIRTRDVYVEYRKCGYSRKFHADHQLEIEQHKAAKTAFDALALTKLPSIPELKSEYAKVLADKKSAYSEYQSTKQTMRELLTAKGNVDRLLRFPATSPEMGTER